MTIREECVSHTLFLCMMHEISIPYTVISSAVEKSSLHSVLPCPFRGRLPILLCHTYDAIPVCKKDPSASLGMTIREKCFLSTAFAGYVGQEHPPTTTKKPQPKLELFCVRKTYLPNCASMVPAATAVPITPATFGPIACISR